MPPYIQKYNLGQTPNIHVIFNVWTLRIIGNLKTSIEHLHFPDGPVKQIKSGSPNVVCYNKRTIFVPLMNVKAESNKASGKIICKARPKVESSRQKTFNDSKLFAIGLDSTKCCNVDLNFKNKCYIYDFQALLTAYIFWQSQSTFAQVELKKCKIFTFDFATYKYN